MRLPHLDHKFDRGIINNLKVPGVNVAVSGGKASQLCGVVNQTHKGGKLEKLFIETRILEVFTYMLLSVLKVMIIDIQQHLNCLHKFFRYSVQ